MNVRIEYLASYQYEEPVTFSPLTLRILPRPDYHLRMREASLDVRPAGSLKILRDLCANEFATVLFDLTLQTRLDVSATFDLEVLDKNPFNFLVANHAVRHPFNYTTDEHSLLLPFLGAPPPLTLASFWEPVADMESASLLTSLLDAIHTKIRYERRETGAPRTPEETLRLGSGACRDTAVLLDAILRQLGFASRLVSGYLCEFKLDDGLRVAEGAMHAWCETFLPGAGWIGLDPTNGVLCDHNYIVTAVARTLDDAAPIRGSYYGPNPVASTLTTSVKLVQS